MIEWYDAVERLRPHVVQVSTPRYRGTGFLLSHGQNSKVTAIATAAHVVSHSKSWQEPIRLRHVASGKEALVRHGDRAVWVDDVMDTGIVLIDKGLLPFPEDVFPLTPPEKKFKVGKDIGWLGFPAIPTADLCFFGGKISAWLNERKEYLVDGVAINGVSGGPACALRESKEAPLNIIGVVSAYIPNKATGETLPGLSVVADIGAYRDIAERIQSIDQAKVQTKKAEGKKPDSDGT